MENKYVKYFLFLCVVIIWGAIIMRFISNNKDTSSGNFKVKTLSQNSKISQSDSFVLYADYSDPFIPEDSNNVDSVIKKSNPVLIINDPILKRNLDSPDIRYIGLISNPNRKIKIAIINLHGKELVVKEKEIIEGIRIFKIDKNKLSAISKGKLYFIKK